ncbi:sensor histidine kinase [Methylobrevis sp. L22]|uniref:histidine kinase n=2 Tax=Methylobrevis albus TaxID=2793297 RepID=A0A931I5N5_9HYPH|nr:sensor histidine kinase [Methylobrevis albus]
MGRDRRQRSPSLLRIVALRILLFGMLAMGIEVAIVFAEYWFDDPNLGRSLIEIEAEALAHGLVERDGRLAYVLPADARTRYRTGGPDLDEDGGQGYFARIRTLDGTVLFSNCGEECTEHFLPLTVNPPSFWQRSLSPGKPLDVVGGQSVDIGGRRVAIELAVLRDPDHRVLQVILHEVFDHMVVPMTLMLTLVIGASIWSVRSALRPVAAAARQAELIDPRDAGARIPTAGMPREVAVLAAAVNRAFGRVGEVIRGQSLFASAIAHEIRTPVAIVKLELEHIDHPRAKKALADLDGLTHVLEQLTALARLDAVDVGAMRPVALGELSAATIESMAPYVYDRGKTITLVDRGGGEVRAIAGLIENLIRNLVENAVRHTPPGTAITVTVGPGPELSVADDGPGLPDDEPIDLGHEAVLKRAGGLGIGRKIVQRIAEIHGATLETTSSRAAGTCVRLVFPVV